jgi:hypothetical protein
VEHNGAAGEVEKVERVVFCSDPRQIKQFNKRKHKHEVKIKRTKKTSLKDKMQTSKHLLDDSFSRLGPLGARGSDTSSIVPPAPIRLPSYPHHQP